MAVVARGQITIRVATDAYAVYQSVDKAAISCDHTGKVLSTLTINSVLSVRCGEIPIIDFSIGAIATPVGFYSITVNQSSKTVTYMISGNNTTLADTGTVAVPVIINGQTLTASFGWFKVKAGVPGSADIKFPDWVTDWDSGKTVIDAQSVITPKIFAGTKNANGTISGMAIGKFTLSTRNASGTITSEVVNGIYGFNGGNKTFEINASGNVQLGNGNEFIKYNAATGKVEFGSAVALAWVGATYIDANGIFTGTLSANTVNAFHINASQITAGTVHADRIDTVSLKSALITAGNIEALTLNVTKGKIGGWSLDADSIFRGTKNNASGAYTAASGSITIGSNGIRGFKWRLDSTGAGAVAGGNISWDAAGNVTFGASVVLNWTTPINAITTALGGSAYPKLTQITATGIYTGTITATQINAGTIDTARLNVDVLKATLITAGNIEALTLNVTKGVIGGWTINSSSISGGQIVLDKANNRIVVYGASSSSTSGNRVQLYHNSNTDFGLFATDSAGSTVVQLGYVNRIAGWTINGTQIYKNSVYLGADGSITNGTKWKLNNDGSGQVANGNIIWDISGNVTFASSVSLQWSTPINNITNALGGSSFPKMTYINSSGIYTGTLTANQVNAVAINASSIITGTLSANRIATGSINATKLDATSIKASIINTDYINGLSCTFTKGTIGGFVIGSDHISTGGIGALGAMPIQIRTAASGSGYWYTGEYKPFGVSMTWHQSSNAGHIVIGQIASAGNSVKTGFMGIQMMSWDNVEYFCLSTNYSRSGNKEVYNRIAGWAFDNANIWKNSVYLGSDGSIYNGTKWRLSNDGSGRVASGNISWDAAGNVTFGSSVSLNWTNAIQTVQNNLTAATDSARTTVIDLIGLNQSTYYPVVLSVSVDKRAIILLYNTLGTSSVPSWSTHGSGFSCECEWTAIGAGWGTRIPIRSILRSTYSWSNALPFGDITQMTQSSQEVIYLRGGGKYYFKTTNVGDISYKTTAYTIHQETVSPKSSVSQPIPDVDQINNTLSNGVLPKVTQITSTGVYTGSVVASQITSGTISADRIAAGSINASKLDAASIKANIINTSYINGLSCTFDKGTIGGWYINSYQIYKNSVVLSSDGSITNSSRWRLNNDGSGQLANGNITWDTAGNVTARGAVFNNVRIQGSLRNPFVLNDSSIWIGGDSSNQQNFNNYDNIVAVRGSWDENISLPWTIANSGRRVTLVNYRWGSTQTVGYMSIYAPSGKFFYEDGLAKSSITFSRELVELLGYGDSTTFFG